MPAALAKRNPARTQKVVLGLAVTAAAAVIALSVVMCSEKLWGKSYGTTLRQKAWDHGNLGLWLYAVTLHKRGRPCHPLKPYIVTVHDGYTYSEKPFSNLNDATTYYNSEQARLAGAGTHPGREFYSATR